jgi:hypothetical protein
MAQFLLAATATHVSLLAYAWARISILSWIKNAFLFFGSLMMKNESQLEIKMKLFASSIHSRLKEQCYHSDLIKMQNLK